MIKAQLIIFLLILFLKHVYCQNVTTVEIPEGRTLYDLQSNSSSFMIEQRASNPLEIHAVFMVSTDGGPSWTSRNVRYFYSSNGGTAWSFIGPVFTTRSGFPSISLTNDGLAVILAHNTEINAVQTTHIAYDLAPGIGSWTILNPGVSNPALGNIWPVCSVDPASNRIIFAASQNGADSAFVNVCTNLSSPGTFTGYKALPQGGTAGQYATAAGTGIYGTAYITLSGGAAYTFTTNGGVSWSAPQVIWTWQPSDSMGAFRGIDITYNGSTPQVVFGLAHTDPVSGTFNPRMPSKIMFWSPAVNGGVPVKIDSARGLTGINSQNDVHVSVCRPVIGSSSAGNFLYAAYSKARPDTGITGNNYFDIFISCSQNGGAGWSAPFRISNLSGPLRDCRYPSISNKNGLFSGLQALNVLYQSDSVPGSSIHGAPESWASMMYARVTNLSCIPVGNQNTHQESPVSYSLRQNYPNPFNPATQIGFTIPKKSFVSLTIYNAIGEIADMLINRVLDAGDYTAEWNASSLPSGVYFYELKAGNFTESKKMILIK